MTELIDASTSTSPRLQSICNSRTEPKFTRTECEETETLILPNDMSFPKASIDPKLIRLQKDVTEFITSVILKHENELYNLFQKQTPEKLEDILGFTTNKIISIIQLLTSKFFNDIYFRIQNNTKDSKTLLVEEMCIFADYGAHILLDKLCRLTFHVHLDIVRENLDITSIDIYNKCLLKEINTSILSLNLLHMLSKSEQDNIPFQHVPEGYEPFQIVIDKNIEI